LERKFCTWAYQDKVANDYSAWGKEAIGWKTHLKNWEGRGRQFWNAYFQLSYSNKPIKK
jgi:hypothetical protein